MKKIIIPLEDADGKNTSLCGNKAAALTKLIKEGLNVPGGLCVSSKAYQTYIKKTGLREKVLMELGRKRFKDMRWEEMWDASLRIRNMFLATPIPRQLEEAIRTAVEECFQGKPVAVRSSSSLEDSSHSSFAGLHESYVNLSGADTIMRHVLLVWASLWSDATLSYRKELSLDIDKSSMSVIIQEMILGEKSGVAFGVHPQNSKQAVIESVHGLNKGLVDGDVEPDRWILDRTTGKPISITPAKRGKAVLPRKHGVGIEGLDPDTAQKPPLSEGEVEEVFNLVKTAEALFGAPQDVEWTIQGKAVYLLQSRPITSVHAENDRRAYDLSLRRTFGNLKGLAERIETVLVPQMIAESAALAIKDLKTMGEADLAAEIQQRKDLLDKWHDVYWEDFIPFGHGVRLFGQTYNERIKPADPYEFVTLLMASDLKSVERNTLLADLANRVRNRLVFGSDNAPEIDEAFGKQLDSFIEKFSGTSCTLAQCTDERKSLLKLLQEMSAAPEKFEETVPQDKATLRVRYLQAFDQDEQEYARELLELGGKSYQMRDDDNIYLGRFETQLVLAVEESRKRLGAGCKDTYACANLEETARALKLNDEEPAKHESISNKEGSMNIKARQLRGQPAGPGIARGPARVVSDVQSLFEVKNGEILVCDAIDPNMTFVIPLVGGIIERRGGMLIHGAIIAREYGLPCVTGIPDATAFIKTGDFVVVDGYYGLVTIESKEQSSWTPAA